MTKIQLYSTKTCKNHIEFISCLHVMSNFVSPTKQYFFGVTCGSLGTVEKLPDSASITVYATPEIHPILTHPCNNII